MFKEMKNICDKLKQKYYKNMFSKIASGVLDTKPIKCDETSKLIVLSMLQHSDVNMYLLAVKSFCNYISPSKVFIVADPSLTDDDILLLKKHIPSLQLVNADKVASSKCPTGGTWERLLTISDLVENNYVIQLDADTLTVGYPEDVEECIKSNKGFLIGTEDNQIFSSLIQASKYADTLINNGATHVQVIAESYLSKVGLMDTNKYVRGSSGFAGFPIGSFDRSVLEEFSTVYEKKLGELWKNWGTEQFSSNYIVSNMKDSIVLPHPKYCAPHRRIPETLFMHFIGYVRYANSSYADYAKDVINIINK